MNQPIFDFFENDHRRIEAILKEATTDLNNINEDLYNSFRAGMLTHIKMEEKILFPAAQVANGGEALSLQAQLRLEHGAITSLMAVKPDKEVIKVINYVLQQHDLKEEQPGGMYDVCEKLTSNQTNELLEKLHSISITPVHPVNPNPSVIMATKRSLLRAGYDFDEIVKM